MSERSAVRGSRILLAVSAAFVLLAIATAQLMGGYWLWIIEPRLRTEAAAYARLLAENQVSGLDAALIAARDSGSARPLVDAIDRIMLSRDPATQQPYVIGLHLETDPFLFPPELAELSRGSAECAGCFPVEVPLIDGDTDELLGLASLLVSDGFFTALRSDMRAQLMAELTLGLALLVVAWVAVYALVRRLSLQVDRRMQVERDLREAKELAEAHSKAKSEFLANMSHEIRTPMNAIIGMAYLLGRTPLDARQAGYLDNLRTSSEVLLQLVNDVLDFSKVEAGKLVLEREVFRVEDVLLRLSAIAGPRAAEKGIELIVRQDVEVPPTLVGDVLRLAQILLNLVNNAIKFTEAGEIVVSVQRRSIDDGVAELLFSVRDTGIGIDPQRLQGLFEPFVQADGSITRRYGGTGLGLSICRRLAEAMGGRIGAESTPGAGSRFWFTVRMGAVYMADQAARAVPDDLRALHVLVIDENSTSRVHCVDLLHQFGFKARAVASAAAAIASVQQADREQPYQLVILDRKLTDADSLVLAHKLKRELPLRKPPRVLLMADFAADAPDAQARTLLDGIIVKPLTRSTMLDGVMDAFGHGMARAGAERPAISKRPAAGLRVLVAEDNSINQAVVAELLREVQCELTLTANGLEALQALESSSFDLVLMDVQMPELDGLEATRRIRAQPALAELPVIAMTAHALPEDLQRCRDAGMNDCVNKPVDVDRFFATLAYWGGRRANAADGGGATGSGGADGPGAAPIDAGELLERCNRKPALMARVLSEFRERHRFADAVIDGIRRDTPEGRVRRLHQLKGEAATIAAHPLVDAVRRCEQAAAGGADDQARALAELQPLLVDTCDAAARLGAEMHSAAGSAQTLPVVDVASGLRRAGRNAALYASLLQRFCDEHGAVGDALAAAASGAADEEARTALRRRVHGARGVAANLGIKRFAELAAAAEQALVRDAVLATEIVAAVQAALADVLAAVPAIVGELQSTAAEGGAAVPAVSPAPESPPRPA